MSFKPYLNQNYQELKDKCLKSKKLFEDDKFKANNSSLAKFKVPENISWKRPHEICENPQFIVDFIEPNDIDQGSLGNCWFISAVSVIASVKEYADRVIPENQAFDEENYAGIFVFRFYRYGQWLEVVVDGMI